MRSLLFTVLAAWLTLGICSADRASAQELETARAVLEANIEATGGLAAWESIEDMYTESEIVLELQQGVIVIANESWRVVPGYLLNITEFVEGPPGIPADQINNIAYVTPDGGFMERGGQRQDLSELPEAAVASFRASTAKNEMDYLGLPDSALVFQGLDEIDDEEVYAIEVTSNGNTQSLFYSTESNLLVATESPNPMGGMALTRILEYEEVGDVLIAFIQEADLGQMGTQTVEIQDVEINEGISVDDLQAMAEERSSAGSGSDSGSDSDSGQ